MLPSNLTKYLPKTYNNIKEINEITEAENGLFDIVKEETDAVMANSFVKLAHEDGIKEFEKLLNISPNLVLDSMEFRKLRVLNRLSTKPPFSEEYLKFKLDELIGPDKWVAIMDYDTYTITIESSAEDQGWFNEISATVLRIKPANIVFINKPKVYNQISLGEAISLSSIIYPYRLGTSWVLGATAFREPTGEGVIKLAGISSVKQGYLDDMAAFGATDVAKAVLNDLVTIDTFITRNSIDNNIIIEYAVASEDIGVINNIKLKNAADEILTESNVYIPVVEDIVLKHSIQVKEGI